MKKILISAALILAMLSLSIFPVGAASGEGTLQPISSNSTPVAYGFDFNGNMGFAWARVNALAGTTKIEASVSLYRTNDSGWKYLTTVTDSVTNSITAEFECPFPVMSTSIYRAEWTITVTRNGVNEVITHIAYSN